MGFKARDVSRTLRTAVLRTLPPGARRSKKQLLSELRASPRISISVRKLKLALSHLIDEGRVVVEGERARARFRRAIAVGARVRGAGATA
jgi:hypothetical protein